MNPLVIAIVVGGLALILLFMAGFFATFYRRVPPSQVMVVFGSGEPRFITSGGALVKPLIEDYKMLDMTIITLKTEKDEVYTINGIPIQLDWVTQVQIDNSDSALRTAARAFLDKSRDEIKQVIADTLSANFRAIVGQMTVETIHRDRDDFIRRVHELAADDITAMGVRIISMGIEEITDGQGYLEAMAAPQIAAIKRDAAIAQAEADREARTKAALSRQQAEQAELSAQREILQQREELDLREVQVQRQISLAKAESEQEVQQKRALAIEKQQEAEVLVPARAEGQAAEIRAEAERKRLIIEAEGQAEKTRTSAEAQASAKERTSRAEAQSLQALKQAEAEGIKAGLVAGAEGKKAEAAALQALKKAEAEGVKAALLAEAEGRREIAAASAAEGEINLRQFVIERLLDAEVKKAEAIAHALAGLGGNVRVVQIGNSGNGSGTGNTFMDMIMNIPEVAEVFKAKVEALSGDSWEATLERASEMLQQLRGKDTVQIPSESPNT